jgi:hypothetical protein
MFQNHGDDTLDDATATEQKKMTTIRGKGPLKTPLSEIIRLL